MQTTAVKKSSMYFYLFCLEKWEQFAQQVSKVLLHH